VLRAGSLDGFALRFVEDPLHDAARRRRRRGQLPCSSVDRVRRRARADIRRPWDESLRSRWTASKQGKQVLASLGVVGHLLPQTTTVFERLRLWVQGRELPFVSLRPWVQCCELLRWRRLGLRLGLGHRARLSTQLHVHDPEVRLARA
jgi:hypothetical protein